MPGLGDAVYCRPYVKAFATAIETKWPDLFPGVPLCEAGEVRPRYDTKSLAFGSIPQVIGKFFPPLAEYRLDLPAFPSPFSGRYAVVRPPTLRAGFFAPARNPRPDYIRRAAELLSRLGYRTVGVGNVRGGAEWFAELPPEVDVAYWRGELSVPDLMGLIAGAAVIVAGPGYTVPASMAYGVPHVIVYGGAAKWNRLNKLTDPRVPHRITTVEPDRFCRACETVRHQCDKTITDFDRKFTYAVGRALSLR